MFEGRTHTFSGIWVSNETINAMASVVDHFFI
jgi:hypothetical protein